MHIVPLSLVSAVAVEHLAAVVLAVGDVDEAIAVAADVVHQIELPRPAPGLSPGGQQPAVRREAMNPGVAVTVGHVDVAIRGERGVGATMERHSAHERRRLARYT